MGVETVRVAAIRIFQELPAGELDSVAAAADELTVPAGKTVAGETDFGHTLYALEDGEVEIVQDGRTIRRLHAGEIFGEIALLKSGRRTASAVAATDCRLLTWFKRDVWRLEERAPGFTTALRESADARLR
jgi:CRP-like cAMP-binding protein